MGKKLNKEYGQSILVASSLDEESDFIPLISDEDEEDANSYQPHHMAQEVPGMRRP